jgi:hypothetical protein
MLAAGRASADISRTFRVHRAAASPVASGACIAVKKLTLSQYQQVAAHTAVQLFEINRFSDRHFWHEDDDKA